jgi:simple sugar transport system ATP-binding protein
MVHQAFKLFDSLTIWENVTYGNEPRRLGFVDRSRARREVAELAGRYHLSVDPDAIAGRVSVGVRQRVEILKALYRDARILILDEPTAVLTPQERDGLFNVMKRLVEDGRTMLFVTHKIPEVMAVTDRITVLRDGRVAARLTTRETSEIEIVRAMTGRSLNITQARPPVALGDVALEARDLTVTTPGGRPLVDNVSLAVRAGEIVGIAGVAGNGQTELVEALTGARAPDAGTVLVHGIEVTGTEIDAHREAGLAHIPEDRASVGTALPASAAENLAMGFHRHAPISRRGVLDNMAMARHARELIQRFGVRIGSEQLPVGTLSGGNLQKVVVARELSHAAPVLIAEQPTRGVDVGAIEFIHGQLMAERKRGCAILLVSADLTEIMTLSDRILVMYEGRILAEVPGSRADEQMLGLLMAGRVAEAA